MDLLCPPASSWPSAACSASQPVTVLQTARPYVLGNYAGVALPPRVIPRVIPRLCNTVTQTPRPGESRFFSLSRSVFDLVNAHHYLSLTDPKLLKWYLSLCPEDRKIIQDEGGFHQFLQRHPALELSQHHVYVKYSAGCSGPARPSVMSDLQLSRPMGEEKCRCEMPHTIYPGNVRETLTLLRPQQHPHVEIFNTEQLLYLQDSFQTAFNHPITQEANHQQMMDSSSAAMCVDVELERSRQWNKPLIWSQTYAEVRPLQSEWPTMEQSPSVDTVHDDEACLSFEDPCEDLNNIMEDDKSILVCVASENGKAHNTDTSSSEALSGNGETSKSVIEANTAEHPPPPCVTTCDVRVGTEPAACTSASTQTEDPGSSDKHVITKVHMADLDYLAEEFIKLKTAKELREQKEQMKSPGCKVGKECECVERAQQAELCVLALQHSMCRQHCWRLYYTSAEEGQLTPLPKSPPVNMASVLQKLDSDYHHMREKILAGVPLEKLPPLSVDSEKITTGARYTPAQIVGVLGNVPSRSEESQKHHTSGEEDTSPENESRNGCQLGQRKEQPKNGKAKRAVTSVPQNRAALCNKSRPTGINTAETWYDAEEDVEPAGPAEIGQEPTVMTKEKTCEPDGEEAKTSVLCVSNLPRNVTESDVMLCFEKYHVCEVNISALKNDLSVAIVTISGPQSAEAAVRELNGFSVRGHTLHVEHLDGSHHPSSEVTTKPQTSKTGASSPDRKLMVQPPLSSSIKSRRMVCISPTAKGTCVPQHYGTMDSFNTLMSELTQHHPDIGRQRIVDALMELKAKHQGVLSSLPLSTIREMTSELLTTANTVQA
ncbi:RNA-binding protein 44 isoform X2 [Larimichthys crocea]|uniref:RNA-binding protein 44 isoform X2 n=1 Tax=Larimichthys crocea TaxID=215358 RepID=UPI000F5E9783|nr:RNA-binding protein 44 isoform X2 [Larimichthys crocea]